jgi:hyperosmotically inducible protein
MKRNTLIPASLASIILIAFLLSGCTAAVVATGGAAGGYKAYETVTDRRAVSGQVDDTVVGAKVRGRFNENSWVKELPVEIFVFNGHVYLVGQVEQAGQASRMAALAQGVEGVRQVTTYLLPTRGVKVQDAAADTAITAQVRGRLIAQKGISSTQISVKTVQGHVVLMGIVDSSYKASTAQKLARKTRGVVVVKNYLKVQ